MPKSANMKRANSFKRVTKGSFQLHQKSMIITTMILQTISLILSNKLINTQQVNTISMKTHLLSFLLSLLLSLLVVKLVSMISERSWKLQFLIFFPFLSLFLLHPPLLFAVVMVKEENLAKLAPMLGKTRRSTTG